jgi:multidrug resistance efflux pump
MISAAPRLVGNSGKLPSNSAPARERAQAENARIVVLEKLIAHEAELRSAGDRDALALIIAHESRLIVEANHTFVLLPDARGHLTVAAASHLTEIDRQAPAIRFLEDRVAEIGKSGPEWLDAPFNLIGRERAPDDPAPYAYLQALGVLLRNRVGEILALVVHTRNFPWMDRDNMVARHIGGCAAHAWAALVPPRRMAAPRLGTWLWIALAAALLALGLIQVPNSVLAPARISATDPFVVTAPMDGVIEDIVVAPNSKVAVGDPIVRYVETTLRNRLALAESEVAVAESKLKRATQGAFVSQDARRELATAEAELKLKRTELTYAREVLSRTRIAAQRAGIVVYADRRDWTGRPVVTGERILDIADPGRVEIAVDLPVEDAIEIPQGSRMRIFLDGDPLNPLSAEVIRVSHEPKLVENRFLAFAVVGALKGSTVPRLGLRGVAQISGEPTTLFYFIFRKPIRAARQWMGV